MLTAEILRRMWPRAPASSIDAIAAASDQILTRYEIDTPLRLAHFMAQISHESGAGTIVREDMNYRAERIAEIFGVGRHSARVTPAEAQRLAHKPEALAERVYGLGNKSKAKELGNTRAGDGYRYRGNGLLQLTGRGAHARLGAKTGFPLEDQPELLEDPEASFRVAAAEFRALGCLAPADADDVVKVTRLVNGGRNGLAERTVWLRRWKQALEGLEEPAKQPRAAPSKVKSIASSKIAQASALGFAGSAIEAGRQLSQVATEVSDAAKGTADSAGTLATIMRPLVASASLPWALLAVVIVGAVGLALLHRWRKLRDEGV